MNNAVVRVVLKRNVSREQVDRMLYFADWNIYEVHQATDDQPFERVIRPAVLDGWVHYIEDPVLGLSYLICKGQDAERAAEVIRAKLPIYSALDVEREPKSTESWNLQLALLAILRQGSFEAAGFERITAGFRNPDPVVRRRAILTVGYLGWLEFAEPLTSLALNDPDIMVRADAETMLGLLESANQLGLTESR